MRGLTEAALDEGAVLVWADEVLARDRQHEVFLVLDWAELGAHILNVRRVVPGETVVQPWVLHSDPVFLVEGELDQGFGADWLAWS